MLISDKVSSKEKNYDYFIVYIDDDVDDEYDDDKIKPFCIMLPQTCVYVKIYDDETKWMYFLIDLFKDDQLLKNNDIWNKVSNRI